MEFMLFFFYESFDAVVAECVSAHGEKSGWVVFRVLFIAKRAVQLIHDSSKLNITQVNYYIKAIYLIFLKYSA